MSTHSSLPRKHLAIAISAALAGFSPAAWSACTPVGTTYTVDTASDAVASDGVTSLREAITAANANSGCDEIVFDASLNGQTIILDPVANTSQMIVADDVNIVGPGSDQLTISQPASASAPPNYTPFNFCNGDIDISGLTVDGNNNSSSYAGIYVYEDSRGDCIGTALTVGSFTADDIVVSNNVDTGGAFGGTGMLISISGDVSISNSQFTGNYNEGIYGNRYDAVTLNNVSASMNGRTGLQFNDYNAATGVSMTNVSVTDNGDSGIGLGAGLTSVNSISDSVITGNIANNYGGGLSLATNGTASIIVANTTIDDNSTDNGFGGGIYIESGGGSISIENSTISRNITISGGGAGIELGYTAGTFAFSIVQSTISGNSADNSFGGGGLRMGYHGSSTPIEIRHSTITGNSSGKGGGVYLNTYSSDINLSHTVIAGNTDTFDSTYDDVYIQEASANTPPSIDEPTNNVIAEFSHIGSNPSTANTLDVEDGSGTPVASSGDAFLDPLADNGGPTLTHLPQFGAGGLSVISPLIDSGDPTAVAGTGDVPLLDQRGQPRQVFTVFGSTIDIGAVELAINRPPALDVPIDAATATIGTAFSIDLDDYFTDPEGDPITYTILSITPAIPSGNLAISGSNASGTFVAGDEGTYSVEYQACDTEPACSTGTGTLTIEAAPAGGSSSSATSPLLAGLLAAAMGLFRLRRR